jgi:hypothetical protein
MSDKKKNAEFVLGLSADEQLLWSGRPPQGVMLRSSDILMIPFSLLWTGFACMWMVVASVGGPFALFGVPFVLVGLYTMFGRFIVDALERQNTVYALTNERVIISTSLFGRRIKSLSLRTLVDVTLQLKRPGGGTIVFGPSNWQGELYRGTRWPGMEKDTAPAFEAIEDAAQVYQQIRQAQSKLGAGEQPGGTW